MKKMNTKRIEIIFCAIVTSVVMFSINLTNEQINNKGIKQASAQLVSKKVVILDAGHGGEDGGAVSENGIKEANINLQITLKVKEILEQEGTKVILTRSDKNAIYDLNSKTLKQKKVSDIRNRVKIGNESNADIFVSIHLNKIPQSRYYGWQCFYKNKNEQSEKLAKSIQEGLNQTIQKENERLVMKIKDIYIIENVKIPVSIVECGFLSNPQEAEELQQDEYQNKIAEGIFTGICTYFRE